MNQNYVDSLTPEERRKQEELERTAVYTSTAPPTEHRHNFTEVGGNCTECGESSITTTDAPTEDRDWKEALIVEVVTDYIVDAEMSDGEAKTAILRGHFENLVAFIETVEATAEARGVDKGYERGVNDSNRQLGEDSFRKAIGD